MIKLIYYPSSILRFFLGIILFVPCFATNQVTLEQIMDTYDEVNNRPPTWIVPFSKDPSYEEYCKKTIIYAPQESDKAEVFKLATDREPVNIAMNSSYNLGKFYSLFKRKTRGSGYSNYYIAEEGKLPPQLAIYCYTPVVKINKNIYETEIDLTNKSLKKIHVINLIGIALDSPFQEDSIYFIENGLKEEFRRDILKKKGEGDKNIIDNKKYPYTHPDVLSISDEKKKELIEKYKNIFNMGFQCALDKEMEKIVISKVGANNFAGLYPGEEKAFFEKIWLPAFKASLALYKEQLMEKKISICSMGGDFSDLEKDLNPFDYKKYGRIPEIFDLKDIDTEKTLFWNAWDPHSFVGNGNKNDPSLDGCFGRLTAMMALCSPLTNRFLAADKVVLVPSSEKEDSIKNNSSNSASIKNNSLSPLSIKKEESAVGNASSVSNIVSPLDSNEKETTLIKNNSSNSASEKKKTLVTGNHVIIALIFIFAGLLVYAFSPKPRATHKKKKRKKKRKKNRHFLYS